MTKYKHVLMISVILASVFLATASAEDHANDTLFQASTISALMSGVFDGTMTFKDLGEHGDFGLGTVDRLDGEMVDLDGHFYQVKSDGIAYTVNDSMKTPFAEVTFFEPDETMHLNGTSNLTMLQKYLESRPPTKNMFYAIRIDGTFDYVKTRSVPAQSKPYPTLTEALKGQKIFEFHNQSGTVVGFWCPDYVKGVNVAGYHFHFLTANRTAGGHLLDLKLENASIKIDKTSEFFMELPDENEFYQANLTGDNQAELKKAETNPK